MHVFQIHSVLTTMLYIIGTYNLDNWVYIYFTEQIVLGILVTPKKEGNSHQNSLIFLMYFSYAILDKERFSKKLRC